MRLWARDSVLVEEMLAIRRNPRYISDVEIPSGVLITSDVERAAFGADALVMAVPSHAMRSVSRSVAPFIRGGPVIVSLAKGLEKETFKRMTEILMEEMPFCAGKIAALSGPNHAEEVSVGIPTATVVACENREVARALQEMFTTPFFRVYTNSDVIGVEIGGATKNVIAIAVGVSDGLGFGDNTRASLMTRGLAEMARLGVALGAKRSTFAGLSGVGDLIATCTSRHSRNRAVGERLGRGEPLEKIISETRMVAEGVGATGIVYELSLEKGVDMPIARMAYEVLYQGRDVRTCVSDLMEREPAEEVR